MNPFTAQLLFTGDLYMTPQGAVARKDDGELEFIGAFGRMSVPDDVSARAGRLVKYGSNRFEYMAAWCDRKLRQAYEQIA